MVKHDILNIIIVLFCLFSFTKCIYWINYDFSSQSAKTIMKFSNKFQSYGVDFMTGDLTKIPFYFKIQATSDDSNSAPLLYFSTDDQNCYNRNQLVKNPNGKTVFMWLKREEFNKDEQELYICVECEEDNCSYTLTVEGKINPIFPPNFVYSYLVGLYNKEMIFQVQGSEKNVYMTIALEGSSKAVFSLEDVYKERIKYKTGSAITFFIGDNQDESNLVNIRVKGADVGEYLTLSVHLVNETLPFKGLAPKDYLLPNDPEITGYLEKDIINEECFPLDLSNDIYKYMNNLYITGRIHTKYARFFIEDENRSFLEESDLKILDGQLSFVVNNNGKMNYICFELLNESNLNQNKMVFSFSLTIPSNPSSLYNYFPPQLTGEIYRRIIPKGEIVFFSGTKNDHTAQKYDYNLYQRKGLTKMFIGECRNYPKCHYSKSELNNLFFQKSINQMAIWTTYNDKSSAIGNDKYVIVAYCEDDDNESNGYCEFETSIVSKGEDIYLVEDENFSKFVVKKEKGRFIVDLLNRRVMGLYIDIMIYSGDVVFNYNSNTKLNDDYNSIIYRKYYLSNKVLFKFHLSFQDLDQIIIEYNAETNSFFTIKYRVNIYNSEELEENVPSGESYLVQIDPTSLSRTKNVFLLNKFYKNKNPFLVNFFDLNCKFEVTRENEKLDFFNGYAQEIIYNSSIGYNSDIYKYTIKINEADLSNYNNKMCMLYISGYEAETKYDREIIIGENINQKVIFNQNFKKIRFLYPHAYNSGFVSLTVYANVIDKAFYLIRVYISNQIFKETYIVNNQIFYLRESHISRVCENNIICPIIVEAEYVSPIKNLNPMLEINIRELKNTPTYLKKNQFKLDLVFGGKIYYLYTDIGKNEIGEITVNFLREYGYIWAKVVRKDQTSVDEEANWRGIYRMPSPDWEDSIQNNRYTKKLTVNPEDTSDCIEGCYLLISIQIMEIGEYVDEYKLYPFSILTNISPNNRAYTDIPKIIIEVDEFVIGNVDLSINERISEFFEVWLPYNSEYVEFDWQSSVAILCINLGGIRPTKNNAHFKLLPQQKSILKITKNEILKKAKELKIVLPCANSLQDVNLVIGVWTDKTDSIDTELYSLRVHQPRLVIEDPLDIILVNTDQKIMCNPKLISDSEYRCLFVVNYDDNDVNMFTPLLVYGTSINQLALNYIYANYIERNIYDEYNIKELNKSIPSFQNCELNSRTNGVNYIYTSSLIKGKYIFINIMSDKPDPIIILTSMPVYNYISYDLFEIYPNPTSEQLFSIPKEKLRLAFPGTNSVMVDIVAVNGQAEVRWKNDPEKVFVLKGFGDSLSLSSGKEIDQLIITNILYDRKSYNVEDPGFIFYISYHIIPQNEISFKEFEEGKSVEMAFKDAELPIILYSKIGAKHLDLSIALTFKDNEVDQLGEYDSQPLLVSAQLVKEESIYFIKKDPDLSPPIEKDVIGHYDTALKTAQILLSEEIIHAYNISESDSPCLYIRIEKNNNINEKIFRKFSVEVEVSGINEGIIPEEQIYHYGKVRNYDRQISYYRLRVDQFRPYMRIQLAFNSDNLDFVVSEDENQRVNTTFLKTEKARGKIYITLKVKEDKELYYLYIFKKQKFSSDELLNNYAFKYINAKDESELVDYLITDSSEISITESKEGNMDIITCTFNKLDIEPGKANITYFFKVVGNSTYIYGEEINTIAVTESPYYTVYERNPFDIDGKIILTAKGINLSNWVYLNVIAQIQQNNVLEYISYNGNKKYKTKEPIVFNNLE